MVYHIQTILANKTICKTLTKKAEAAAAANIVVAIEMAAFREG